MVITWLWCHHSVVLIKRKVDTYLNSIGEKGPAKKNDGTDDDDNSDDDNFDNHNDDDARDGSDHYGWLGMRVRGFPR